MLDEVLGGAVVVVVSGTVDVVVEVLVDVVVVVSGGASSPNGTGALLPPCTYTGVPFSTVSWNHGDVAMGMRTQPWDAG